MSGDPLGWRLGPPHKIAMLVCMTGLATFFAAPTASAQEDTTEAVAAEGQSDAAADAGETETAEEAPAPLVRPSRRELPNYEGREPEPPSVGDQLLWIPRILLRPVYFVTEYLLRYPLGRIVSTAEEEEVTARFIDFFRFGEDNNILIAPTISLDFGLRSNVGLMMRVSDVGTEGLGFSANATFGGVRYVSGSLGLGYESSDDDWSIGLQLSAFRRADGQFLGIGREADEDAQAQFNTTRYDVGATFQHALWRQSWVRLGFGYRVQTFGDRVNGTSIDEVFAQGAISALPNGYEDGYEALWGSFDFALDTRPDRPEPGSGIRLRGSVYAATDPGDSATWIRYGGALGAYLDMSGSQHIISATLSLLFADAIKGQVPFTDLPVLSGNGPMRGFVGRLLTGESAAALTLEYSWPIWVFADAKVHATLGNVFGHHLQGFDIQDLRLSFGVGIAAVSRRQHIFEVLVGFGTDTLADGPDVQAVRFMFGVTREF